MDFWGVDLFGVFAFFIVDDEVEDDIVVVLLFVVPNIVDDDDKFREEEEEEELVYNSFANSLFECRDSAHGWDVPNGEVMELKEKI